MNTYTICSEDGKPISVFHATTEDKDRIVALFSEFFGFDSSKVVVVVGNKMPEKFN